MLLDCAQKTLVGILVFSALTTAGPVHKLNMEDKIDVTLEVAGQELSLNLTRNQHISHVPIFVGTDEGIVRMPDDADTEDCAAYIDESKNAAFIVTTGNNGKKQYHGVFSYDSHDYVIEPRDSPIQSRRHKRDVGVELHSVDLGDSLLYETDARQLEFDDEERYPEVSDDELNIGRDSTGYYNGGYRSHGVQMLVAVDYKVYRRWRELTRSYNDAIFGIRNYFTHVVNGIDLRYRSIRESRFGIYVKLAGIYIAETTSASYWTMKSGIREADTYTQGYKALEEFEGWIADPVTRNNLPPFDQATLFTGNTLFRHRQDGSRRPFSGLAAYNSICRFRAPYGSASINHDGGVYASIQTGAHELGHNLGARHDSSNTNGCDSSDQYIMAVSPGSLHDGNFYNTFTFSRCSIDNFEQFLLYELRDDQNCLLDRADHESSSEVDYHLRHLPGTLYDVDHQCQMLYGSRSFYCAGGHADDSLCHRMHCYDPKKDECVVRVEQRAYDGTTCGDHEWCEDGECVYGRYAPSTADSCIYGDYRARIRYVDLTCSEMVEQEPYRCYDERYYDQCCESCAKLKERSTEECPFGDKRPSYCATIDKHDCYAKYSSYAIDNCCGTCARLNSGVEGCEYGDKATWCSKVADPDETWQCYGSQETCCESCPKIKMDIPDCDYGDRASWCESYIRASPHQCERSTTARTCCATCHKIKQAVSVEESEETTFVDRASWCKDLFPGYCYSQRTRETCAKRCHDNETNRSSCMYGDKHKWCQAKYCDTDGEACCDTCR